MCFFLVTTAQYSWKNKIKTFFQQFSANLIKPRRFYIVFNFNCGFTKPRYSIFLEEQYSIHANLFS